MALRRSPRAGGWEGRKLAESLLEGVRVVDLCGEPAELAGRMLADLGAEVVKVEPPGGDPLRREAPFVGERRDPEASLRFAALNAGKRSLECSSGDARLDALLAGADVVLDTPGWPGVLEIDPGRAPGAVWVHVTPFGLEGPRAGWRAHDLGVLAAGAHLYTNAGDDRAPVVVGEPIAYANVAVDAVIGALAGLWSGQPQRVDVSGQETMTVASMGGPTRVALARRTAGPEGPGSRTRRTGPGGRGALREIWRCRDGFVQFGLRGGHARVPTFRFMTGLLEEEGLSNAFWREQDWASFNQHELSDEQKIQLQEPLARYFERHTLLELYELAGENALTLATVNSPREIYASSQLASRGFFDKLGDLPGFPRHFALARSADGQVETPGARAPAPALGAGPVPDWAPRQRPSPAAGRSGQGAFSGTRLVEFGSGAAGPIASRYFAEQGAEIVRVESRSRPEFLRMMAVAAKSPHGVEGDHIFNAFNVGKQSVTLNLKKPGGLEVAKRLIHWADGVLENFSPKAMAGFGLDYDTLAAEKTDLVMISTCINGQTGPHRRYPGFGPQGSALSGYTHLTGYADADPISGTVTDFLAPRFAAVALSAALHYRKRTGRGVYLDLSQVEAALYTLSPWLLDFAVNGRIGERDGNRSGRAVPHGIFPCREGRWVAVAARSDAEWALLAGILGLDDSGLAGLPARQARVGEVEERVCAYTRERSAEQVAERLQAEGLEAVPVADAGDLLSDPQLAARGHFQDLEHPVLGLCPYEHNGIRFGACPTRYASPSPTLGQHTDGVLTGTLGYAPAEVERLKAEGGVE